MKIYVPDRSTIFGALLAAQVASPSENIASMERSGWQILPDTIITTSTDPAILTFTRYTLPVHSSDNFDGGDRKFVEPVDGLTPENEIESGESKNQALRPENETTTGNFSYRLRDEASENFDRNYSLGSISSRR